MVDDVGVLGNELLGAILDLLDAGDDGSPEIVQRLGVLARSVVDHAVDIALHEQFVRRQADVLGALLPRQTQASCNVCQALRLNGAEHPIAQRQDHIARRQWNSTAGVPQAEDDPQIGHIDVAHLGDQTGNAVGLVMGVGQFFGIRPRRIHQADNRNGAHRALLDDLSGGEMMLGHPDAVLRRSILSDERDPAHLSREVHLQRRGVEWPVTDLIEDPIAQLANDVGRVVPGRVFSRCNDGFDV